MKPNLKPGQVGRLTWTVDPTMTITLGPAEDVTVFSTPNMILLMERSARVAIEPFLEEGEESVGVRVDIEHLGPALLGHAVDAIARVTKVDGRRVDFEVQAFVGDREIGRGRHQRAIVSLSRMAENLSRYRSDSQQSLQTPTPSSTSGPSMPGPFETLEVRIADRIATVTLNRPQALNVVNRQMTAEFEQLVAWLASHPTQVRVVILTGAGDAFCAGDDVKELAEMSIEEAGRLSYQQASMYLALERLPQPVIAAVGGVALGGGCVAAYSCDLRIASFTSRFGMPEIKLGWPPGYGIAQLMATVGKPRALQMCLLGETISAVTAMEWGLVHEVVAQANLIDRAEQIAKSMLALPAEALRQTKRVIHADEGQLPKLTYRADTDAYLRCLSLPDAREGIAAFKQKRPARFSGQ